MDKLMNEQNIINEIVGRTGGDFSKMNYGEIGMLNLIFKRRKKSIDEFMNREYYKIKMWAELDMDDVMLRQSEPDMSMISDSFVEQFTKLMGI